MIAIHVELYRDAFHGLRGTGEPDWPPGPYRPLGTLIAGAHTLSEDDPHRDRALDALRRVAAAPPPVIETPDHQVLGLPPTYAPKTWLPEEKAVKDISNHLDLSLVGMDSGSRTLKPQNGVVLAGRDIRFYVDLDCDEAELAALDAAAKRVPYFGTSKDPADVTVTASDLPPAIPPTVVRWYPNPGGPTRGWQPNTIDWLEANYQRVFGHDPAVTQLPPIPSAGFVQPLQYESEPPEARVRLPIARLTRAVPNNHIPKLMAPLHAELSEALPGWSLFPITISHEVDARMANGDGRCVGFGLKHSNPGTLTPDVVAEVTGVLARSVAFLPAAKTGFVVGDSGALRSSTWVGPAEIWYSVTPLRAFPDERIVKYQLAAELKERYGTELVDLQLRRTPRIRRDGRWSNAVLSDGLDQWWAEIALSELIDGPLLLGAGTEYGFGTFRPRRKK